MRKYAALKGLDADPTAAERDYLPHPGDYVYFRWNNATSSVTVSHVGVVMDVEDGMHGTDVENVQTRLSYLAYDPGTIDGYFGKNTETAVKNFQRYAGPFLGGLTVDGIVGAATKEALRHPAID